MDAHKRCNDGGARIFSNALKSIKIPQASSRKASITCLENLACETTKPATHLPLTHENISKHDVLITFESPNGVKVSKNENSFFNNDINICCPSLLNDQHFFCSWTENNNSTQLKQTLLVDANCEVDLCSNENQLESLKQPNKDSSNLVVDECSLPLLNNQRGIGSWVENNNQSLNQETLHMDVNSDVDLWIKENRLLSLQQLHKDSPDLFIDEWSPTLSNSRSDRFSWVENNQPVLIQETSHMDVNVGLDLWVKDYSDLFVDGWTPPYSQSDMHSWVENNQPNLTKKTLHIDVNSGVDMWLGENRIQTMQQRGNSLEQYYSNAFPPPYCTDSTGEMSPSDYLSINVLSHSPGNSYFSYEENSSKSKDASIRNNKFIESERSSLYKVLKAQSVQRRNSLSYHKSPLMNSTLFERQNDTDDGKIEPVCENTTEYMNLSWYKMALVKEDVQQLDQFVVDHKSSFNEVVSTSCDLLGEKYKKPMVKDKNIVAKLPGYDAQNLMTLKSTTGFFDAHCHLDFLFIRQGFQGTYADYMAIHKDSYPVSYKGCIAVFCKPLTFSRKFVWQKHLEEDNVWATFGCHPKEAEDYNDQIEEDLKAALDHHKVKALGEIGLDYSKGNTCPKDVQQIVFRRQLKVAYERKLRLVIHCRDADEDTIKIMLEVFPKDTIFHLHCFTGDWVMALRWINAFPNVFIGITNLVTFPSATPTHEVARKLPLERLLLETDAPYFVPSIVSKGTHFSHPGMAIHVAAQIAALQNIPVEKVLQWTSSNTKLMYDIQ